MSFDKKNIAIGAVWSSLSSGIATSIKLITIPFLARLLSPEDFGNVAVCLAVITFVSMMFGQGGLGSSIVYFEKDNHIVRNTVFWVNSLTSLLLFLVTITYASEITYYLGLTEATYYLTALAIIFPLYMMSASGYYILMKEMKFHLISRVVIIASVSSSVTGLILAFNGFGAWSLVVQNILYHLLVCVLLFVEAKYLPKLEISFKMLKTIFPYASLVTISDALLWVATDGPLILIAKIAGVNNTGYFTVINRLAQLPRNILGSSLQNALFSGLVNHDADHISKSASLLWSIKVNIYVLGSIYGALAALSEFIVPLVLGNKYLNYSNVLFWLSLGMVFTSPVGGIFAHFKANNKLNLMMMLSILRAIVILTGVWIGWYYEPSLTGIVKGIAASQVIYLVLVITFLANTKDNIMQIKLYSLKYSILSVIITSVFMYILGYYFSIYIDGYILPLVFTSLAGLFVYAYLLSILCSSDYFAVKKLIVEKLR